MNNIQRIIVLIGAVGVAILFHTHFCDWRRGCDAYFLLLKISDIKVDGKELIELREDFLINYRTEIEYNSSKINDRILTEKRSELRILEKNIRSDEENGKEINDTDKYNAIYGIYAGWRLRPLIVGSTKQTAFIFGVILPMLILIIGIFVASTIVIHYRVN